MSRTIKGLLTTAAALVALGGGAVLVWRIVDVSRKAARKDPPARPEKTRGGQKKTDAQTGLVRGVVLKYFNPDSGKLELIVKATRGNTSGGSCTLEEVELERVGDGTDARMLVTARTGTYDRKTGSGRLVGDVVARRFLPDGKEVDLVIRGEELSWSSAAEALTSDDYVEAVWHDRERGRTLSARGQGLRAERWTRTVRLAGDTCVSFSGAVISRGIDLSGEKGAKRSPPKEGGGRATTVVTSVGPARFEQDAAPGLHRISFSREVAVRSRELGGEGREARLDCDRLALWIREPGPAGAGAQGPDLSLVQTVTAGPALLPTSSRWLVSALRPDPARGGRAARRSSPGKNETDRVDLVVARGSVRLQARSGEARCEQAWFDGPAGILWLEGTPEEPAEVVRGGNKEQMIADSFWFDTVTGDMGRSGRGRVTITIEE
ncbi:MAG: hypothetical protein ACYTGB_09190 [Planctomycetota bacterium]